MPEEYMGDIIGDLNSRRGRIEGMDDLGGGKIVQEVFSFFSESKMESDVIFFRRSFNDVDYLTIAVYSMSTTFFIFLNYLFKLI